jgi:hypothetical protein
MKFKNIDAWIDGLLVNTDPYGNAVFQYAEQWADLMEKRIASGESVGDVAKQTSHDADTEGITGFMYGCAVSILAEAWEHGEALRRWHNLDTQVGQEGEAANERGTTLNPALLGVSVGGDTP